jgi:hypothetical protein
MSDYKMVMSEEFIGTVKRGAFDHWVGETVPVRGPDRQIIGEATVTSVDHRDDGTVAVEVSTELALDYDGLARITGTLCGRDSMSFAPVEPDPPMPLLDALVGKGHWHWDDDTPRVRLPHHPMRDDDVAKWLKAKRDSWGENSFSYTAIDELLDEYRARADYGFTLDHDMSELEGRW